MYVNKCIKCGREFETKNPKRVICPDCLYPDKKMIISSDVPVEEAKPVQQEEQPKFYSSYSAGEGREARPQQRPNNYNRNRQSGYNRNNNCPRYNNQRSQQGEEGG